MTDRMNYLMLKHQIQATNEELEEKED
jgi:hypothetical protein